MQGDLMRRSVAEALGTALVLAAVVGSGIMAIGWPVGMSRLRCSPIRFRRARRSWR